MQRNAQTAGQEGLRQSVKRPLTITLVRTDAPGNDRTGPNSEYIRIRNISPQPVELADLAIQDDQNNSSVFSSPRPRPGYTFLLSDGGRNSV